MKVYFFKPDRLEEYRKKVLENLRNYEDGDLNFVNASDLALSSSLNIEEFEFDMSYEKPSDSDFENIKRFYLAFKQLKDNQADEEILWAGLCHITPFKEYVKYRWDCKDENIILKRYFFGSDRPKFNNALARLWWYGRMTYEENSKNPFELTEYICENLTTKGYLTITFAFSNNERLCRVYFMTMMDFEKKNKLTVKEYEKVRRYINLLGGKILIDSLDDKYFSEIIKKYLNKLVQNRGNFEEKECPKCNIKAKNKEEIENIFGWRTIRDKKIPQSHCKKCRSNKTD
jgi:hypothetical protein